LIELLHPQSVMESWENVSIKGEVKERGALKEGKV
jgi:hypothetical protein